MMNTLDDVRTLAEQIEELHWRLCPIPNAPPQDKRKCRYWKLIADTLRAYGERRYREGVEDGKTSYLDPLGH